MHRDAYKPGLEPTDPSAAHFMESEAGLNRKCNDEAVGGTDQISRRSPVRPDHGRDHD
jgi:hypothetical protein